MIKEICPLRPSSDLPPSETLTLLDELLRKLKPIFGHAGLQRGALGPLRLTPPSLEPSPREMRSGGMDSRNWQMRHPPAVAYQPDARRPDHRVWPLKFSFGEVT